MACDKATWRAALNCDAGAIGVGKAGLVIETSRKNAVRKALAQLEASDAFSKAPKLRDFVIHVVTAALEGRADQINATSIAQSVYGRGPGFDGQSDPIVRVEAGRLRSRLRDYYAAEGAADPVIIEIPKGGYAPRFESRETTQALGVTVTPQVPEQRPILKWAVAGVAFASFAVLAASLITRETDTAAYTPVFTENTEAYALFDEALIVGRPPHIEVRLSAGLDLAKQAVALDPSFGGGYAAESYLTWLYIVFGHSAAPEEDKVRSLALARKAIDVDPEFGWGYYSLSRALQLKGDTDGGVRAALNAVDIDPTSAEFQANYGLTLITMGRYSEAIPPIEEAIRLSEDNVRIPYRNYLGMALYHSGRFNESANVIQDNRDRGGPDGPHMLAYLAAAYVGAGHSGKAQAIAELVKADQTGFSAETFIRSLISDPDGRAILLSSLAALGIDVSGA